MFSRDLSRYNQYLVAILCAVPLILGISQSAIADFEAGKRAYLEGDYETAYKEWLDAGEAGNAEALYLIGSMHDVERGVKFDVEKVRNFWMRAAELGEPRAQSMIGFLLTDETQRKYYFDPAPANAVRIGLGWTMRAAQNRSLSAYKALAFAYCNGTGVEKLPDLAAAWYFLAEEEEDRGKPPSAILKCGLDDDSPYRLKAIQLKAMALRQAYDLPLRSAVSDQIDWFD